MARTVRTLLSPYQSEERAIAYLHQIGVTHIRATDWKMKPYGGEDQDIPMGYARPYRKRGKLRKGQHRSHTCSRTGGGNQRHSGN